ncbi:helix-turn-helix transcriptional regulator [Turicibacter sanguinis]|uniref:helix-turn-helix transcriptional regulator n=2 Tax=Turicibacteraceae TaxID=2810281 RepID=UPI0023306382|nr:helix-turn-helix transcriptional regulator [Turicibacter sanguinis]MDB8576047.1 helix-turn-helix transcriptional regulator [Turicibacter sanguinis]MDB8579086.1 helix-turn-helix transcriptional regulator [Turicibacter sanguinis]MDB8584929.1 helix-turn-helix transcriptional regulator [Turicibacter sanguinis]MDB8587905.1 helix-turn-helix transcriptional regulator [Turicibacter sanguinis]MDB8598688.1 helix-turn-helix transcriptional regulator [Turicibacter sanguinis]
MKHNMLKNVRKSKGLTQDRVARELNISLSHYKSMENGIRNVTLMNARKLSLLFEKNIEDIFFEQ